MSEETTTNPVEDDVLSSDAGVADSDEFDTSGQSDDGSQGDEDEELEDFEFDGKAIPLPKSVKEALSKGVMLQADYTRKTQELSEARRAFDTEKQAQVERDQTFRVESAKLYSVKEQLQAFKTVDWAAAAALDAQNGTQTVSLAKIEMDRLKDEAASLEQSINHKTSERQQETQRNTAKLIEQRDAALVQEFPKWADERPQIEAFAKANGITEDELKSTTDPRVFRMMRYAKLGLEAEQRTKAAKTVQSQQQVTPVTTLTAARRVSAPASSPASMRQSADAWAEQRNRELAAKAKAARASR